jgi:3-dehydroquinate dehydratase/shikimate dehydrogenase
MEWIVSLTPEADAAPLKALAAPPEGAAIVELRADLFPDLDLQSAIDSCPLPVMVTLRSTVEGGRGPDDPTLRRKILAAARDASAALIDLEYRRDAHLADDLGLAPEQSVLSWHDSAGTPDDLVQTADEMLASQARWIKIVPTARSTADLAAVLALHQRFNRQSRGRRRLMAFAMGTVGIASRYLAPLLGPPVSYAAWSSEAAAAPGQLTITQTEGVIGHLNGSPQRLYGVIGSDVSGSLSPAMHAAAYRALSLPYLLLPISVPDPEELTELFAPRGSTLFDSIGLETWGWAVTTPYKRHAAAAADRHAPRVLRAGAANTLVLGEHVVTAENTDADGIVGSLVNHGVDPAGMTALVAGTGGAARGAAVGLHLAGAEVALRGREAGRTLRIADEIDVHGLAPGDEMVGAAVLVNATPLGSRPDDAAPFNAAEIEAADVVVDMVYANHETTLVQLAREAGVAPVDGRMVLLHQGIAQFAAFTQTVPPREAMRSVLESVD